jgi:small conductance mechanosensitive channel
MFDQIKFEDIYDYLITEGFVQNALRVLYALIVLIIGFRVIKFMSKLLSRRLEKGKIDPSLRSFLAHIIQIILKIALVISVLSMVGVEVTSFIALLGSIGLAVGLALQGSLSNFAGGVLILLLKPFKVGDYIETKDHSGTVKDIDIFHTILATPNGQKVVIPNATLANSSLTNYSYYPNRRIDLTVSCHYDNDVNLVKTILLEMVNNHELVLKDPAPVVVLAEYGNSSINFKVRAWVKNSDYWNVYWNFMHQVKAIFDQNQVTIPYPQLDVHLFDNETKKN